MRGRDDAAAVYRAALVRDAPDLADAHFNLARLCEAARIAPGRGAAPERFSQAHWRPVTSRLRAADTRDRGRQERPDDASGPRPTASPDPVHRQQLYVAQPSCRACCRISRQRSNIRTRVEFDLIFAGGRVSSATGMPASPGRLAKQSWNYVVLQEQSTLPVKNPGRYHENVRLFAPEIARRGADGALFDVVEAAGARPGIASPRRRESRRRDRRTRSSRSRRCLARRSWPRHTDIPLHATDEAAVIRAAAGSLPGGVRVPGPLVRASAARDFPFPSRCGSDRDVAAALHAVASLVAAALAVRGDGDVVHVSSA